MELEHKMMKQFSDRVVSISDSDDKKLLAETKQLLRKLSKMNRRWNISELDMFIKQHQKKIFSRA